MDNSTTNPPATSWLSQAQPHLDRINGRSASKKRAAILAVLSSELLSTPLNWSRKDLPAKSTWYDHWNKDALVMEVHTSIRKLILDARSETAVLAVQQALEIIQNSALDAAETLVKLLGEDYHPSVRRLAADSILNRASEVTAEKSSGDSTFNADQLAKMSAQATADLSEWEAAQGDEDFEL